MDAFVLRLFVVAEALHRPDMPFHHGGHLIPVRHGHLFSEQQLDEEGAAGPGAFFCHPGSAGTPDCSYLSLTFPVDIFKLFSDSVHVEIHPVPVAVVQV